MYEGRDDIKQLSCTLYIIILFVYIIHKHNILNKKWEIYSEFDYYSVLDG